MDYAASNKANCNIKILESSQTESSHSYNNQPFSGK